MKFFLDINNEHAQDYSCPRATFAFCSHIEKLPRQGGLPGVVQRVTRLSKLPRGNEKLICEQFQASDHAPRQSRPGVSELPRDHVNRPLVCIIGDWKRNCIPAQYSCHMTRENTPER